MPSSPSRDELAAMSTEEVNAFLESRGIDVRVVEEPKEPVMERVAEWADRAVEKVERREKLTPVENAAFLVRVFEGGDPNSPAMSCASAVAVLSGLLDELFRLTPQEAIARDREARESGLREALERRHERACSCSFDGTDPDCNLQISGTWLGAMLQASPAANDSIP